jgi:hypothetical protein
MEIIEITNCQSCSKETNGKENICTFCDTKKITSLHALLSRINYLQNCFNFNPKLKNNSNLVSYLKNLDEESKKYDEYLKKGYFYTPFDNSPLIKIEDANHDSDDE